MSGKYKFANDGHLYFVSFAVVYWIDLFTRTDYCKTIFDSLKFCENNKGLELYAYCIMPSHLHLIIGSHKDPLEGIIRDFKSFTSRKLREEIQSHSGESRKEWLLWMMKRAGTKSKHHDGFQLWQEGSHPIELSTPVITEQKLNYIHNNPVEAGLVYKPEDWRYSSASNYLNLPSEREVILLGPFYK
jgi:putative transposase